VKRIFGILFILCLLLLAVGTPVSAQSTGSQYFKDTGHFVTGEFLTYYQSISNASFLFGYPITEAFMKNGRLVQYFQRARFELHPELPVGQRVNFAPIGKAMYVPGERLDIFNPFACRYFSTTGFSVCYAFLDFYKANNGEERFGQPISSFEYHNDLIVQYFENVRLEWKPWMPEGQRVSVADLGRPFFDQEKEDPNLLKPVDPGNRIGTLITLQVRAFVWKAVTLASDQQLVYIIVQDQTLLPVAGAQGTATILWADGTSTALNFVTNSSGVGIVPLTFSNQPYGKMVNIEIAVTKEELSGTTTTSFRIWY
jgi:hypothetical protein